MVGARVRVQVSRVDLDGRKIDFRMVREGELDRPQAKGEKPRSASATEELAGVREADRAARAGARGKKGNPPADPARRSRKPAAKRPAPKPRVRR